MNDYDFSTLNDKEFENLTIDLISRDRGKRFERFKAGRDGGIDGRYYGEDGKQEIIQCKHSPTKRTYASLKYELKNKKTKGKTEVDKVKLLNPKKYIFVTSLTLSEFNKQEIKEIFKPYIKSDSDIYGQEDLNDLLKANSDIEESHYKLWISSTTVLQRIFNNAIKGRSEFLLDEIKEKIKYYVVTENHNKAIQKLEESHTIIIAGEAGVGKTTLAEQILLKYREQEFECYVISNSINEAEAIWESDKKQIFYFDDFLGSNVLSAFNAHEDSHIMQFIARIKRDKNKRFILTSRTHIVKTSIVRSNSFKNKNLNSDEFILRVENLEEIDKAKILYNHMWYSDLDEAYIDEIYKEKRYRKIINHRNFNPRLIDLFTKGIIVKSILPKKYWEYIQNKLNNPEEIWSEPFDIESDDFMRNIVLLTVFNGNFIEENELHRAFNSLKKMMNLQSINHINRDFKTTIKDVMDSFIKRSMIDTTIEYSLENPSIADFIFERYKNDLDYLIYIFKSLRTKESLNLIYDLIYVIITEDEYKKIILSLEYTVNDDINYLVKLANLLFQVWNNCLLKDEDLLLWETNMQNIVNTIMKKEDDILKKDMYSFLEVVNYLANHVSKIEKLKITPKIVEKIIDAIDIERSDNSNLREIMNFIEDNNILLSSSEFKNSFDKLNKKIKTSFIYDMDTIFTSDITLKKIEELIIDEIEEKTKSYIKEKFEEISLYSKYKYINGDFIIKNFDDNAIKAKIKDELISTFLDYHIYDLFVEKENEETSKNLIKEPPNLHKVASDSKIDDIDELFDRS